MEATKEQVLEALRHVDDPDLKQDACPMKDLIEKEIIQSVHHMVDSNLKVDVNFGATVSSSRSSSEVLLPGVKNIVVVASGKGGVGKSTVAVNLSCGLSKMGAKVGLIDADIHGPSIPTMLGMKNEKPGVVNVDGKHKIVPLEKYGIKILSIGFLADETQAVVWRGPMVSSALKQFIGDAVWGDLDYLILDLPPGTGDVHLTLVQTLPITGAVIVTIIGIVENMAYFSPPELPDQKYYIFGSGGGEKLAEEYNVPLLGQIPITEPVRVSGDRGTPVILDEDNDIVVSAFDNFVEYTASQISVLNAQKPELAEIENNND